MTRRRTWRACAAAVLTVALALPGPAAAELTPPPPPTIDAPVAGWPDPPSVSAPVHLLVDAATGQVLAAHAADDQRPVASTVKILTALTAADRLDLGDEVVVGDEVTGLVGASVELTPGDRWTARQLIEGLLLRSGNDAAEALAVAAAGDRDRFVAAMIDDARAVGLPVGAPGGPTITSVSGLDDTQRFSARDLATLARVLLADPELRAIVAAPEVELPGIGTDENRNLLVGRYPGASGVKTGFTEAAGNGLVGSATRDGRELIVVVLGGGPDPERFDDAAALLDHGFRAFESVEPAAEVVLLVAGGALRVTVDPVPVTVPTGAEVVVDLPLPAWAPEDGVLRAPLEVDGREVAEVAATVSGDGGEPVEGAAALGRAAVDGVHAALRAAHDRDRLPVP